MDNKNEKVFNLLEATNLNWTVNKEPLITLDGKETGSFGMFRNDTQKWLGTVGNGYTPFQNFEMAELMVKASEGIGLDMTKGGFLQEGKKVFLQIPLEDKFVGRDTIKRNLTCLNSHNGTSSIGFGSTNTVVICSNTFHKAFKDSSMSKFRHSANSKENVKRAMEDMRKAMGLDEDLMRKFEVMANMPIKDEIFSRIMNKVFDIDLDKKSEDFSTRKVNTMKVIASTMESELESHGNTLWGLFNGVTYYTNHVAPKDKDEKEDYIMFGGGYDKNLSAFNEVMKWIEENSKSPVEALIR